MRILHVITSLHIGGAERLMTTLLPRIRELGHEVELLVFDGTRTAFTESLEKSGIQVHSLNAANVYSPLNILKLRKYIGRYDIIHTHNTACQLFLPIAKMLAFGKKARLFTTEHSTNNRRRDKGWFRPLDRWMYSRYRGIVCIGETTEQNLRSYLSRDVPTCVIHNGIEIPEAKIATVPAREEVVTISMVAAFRVGKDQDSLVRAMKLLPERYHLRLIGDGERRKEVETLVNSLGLQDRVEFLGNRSDVAELLRQSHINVLSSHWEGLSLSSLECMASARPFIASDVQGLHEIVEGYGVLFPDGDSEALADAIRRLTEDADYYKEVSEKCLLRARQYDIAATATAYSNLYDNGKP